MFVFQTQSASTASRVIDHRAKEVARREGHTHKSTREGGGAENMYIVCLYVYMYMYIHVHVHVYTCTCTCIYMF